jgi:hypothetical protein
MNDIKKRSKKKKSTLHSSGIDVYLLRGGERNPQNEVELSTNLNSSKKKREEKHTRAISTLGREARVTKLPGLPIVC